MANVNIGGTGRPVIGRIVPDDASRKIAWTTGYHTFSTILPKSASYRTGEEYQKWYNSPENQGAREALRTYPIFFDNDGSFHAEDVPPGRYQMNLSLYEPREESAANPAPGYGTIAGSLSHEFEIGPIPGNRSDEPLDLGSLEFKTRRVVGSSR